MISLDLSSSWLDGVVQDNSSLFFLRNLKNLNLACNDFHESKISSKFGQFFEPRHLDLSSSSFSGRVPTEIFHLSKLVSLDLSCDDECDVSAGLGKKDFDKLLQNLTKLRSLHLDNINMQAVATDSFVNISSIPLRSLSLRNSLLQGKLPIDVFKLPLLQKLILAENDASGHLPKSSRSIPLRILDLYQTRLSGILPKTIGNLLYLDVLDLSQCLFKGPIPTSLGNLTEHTYLDLSSTL